MNKICAFCKREFKARKERKYCSRQCYYFKPHSEERCRKNSEAKIKVWQNPEYRKKVAEIYRNSIPRKLALEKMHQATKGKRMSPSTEFKKGHIPLAPFKKGLIPWSTGKKIPKEICKKMSEARKVGIIEGRIKIWNKGKKCPQFSKENHPQWKGGLTPLQHSIRTSFEYRQWRSDVFTKDNYTCQECGKRGCYLEVHHKKSFVKILRENNIKTLGEAIQCAELWNINNGRTLCKDCHSKTKTYWRNLIQDLKRKSGFCIEDDCHKETEDGERCEEHYIEHLIDSADETVSPFFCDDEKQK